MTICTKLLPLCIMTVITYITYDAPKKEIDERIDCTVIAVYTDGHTDYVTNLQYQPSIGEQIGAYRIYSVVDYWYDGLRYDKMYFIAKAVLR